jgi:glycosyltransferase involved in cell wall biosynthesis
MPNLRTLITFIQPNKSFLPGLQAYERFLSKINVPFEIIGSEEVATYKTAVEWHFMGKDFRTTRPTDRFIIHEYCSLSIPPFAKAKNIWKKVKNLRPDVRIFSNAQIREEFNFQDGIPSFIREVGVDTQIFHPSDHQTEKKNDFIYVGTVDSSREISRMLDYFTSKHMTQYSVLIVSKEYDQLEKKYKNQRHIRFEGPLPVTEVAERIRSSKYAINYIPEIYPYEMQASTKLLEYAACKVPILTTNGSWIRKFERDLGGNYYYFNDKQPYFHPDDLARFNFSFPDLIQLDWELLILESGILQDLYRRFPDLFKDCTIKDKLV